MCSKKGVTVAVVSASPASTASRFSRFDAEHTLATVGLRKLLVAGSGSKNFGDELDVADNAERVLLAVKPSHGQNDEEPGFAERRQRRCLYRVEHSG